MSVLLNTSKLIRVALQRQGGEATKTVNTVATSPPPSILPKNPKKIKLLDIDPLELARQLSILEQELYKKIRPIECLTRSRESSRIGKSSDNISNIIRLTNRVSLEYVVSRAITHRYH